MLDAENIGSIYELQGLSELHYYLKAEHEFTPVEVEALLSFQDPLDVARLCREENTHEHSFPICDLLKEIQAEQKFPMIVNEAEKQHRKYLELMSLVGKDYYIYREKLEDCSNRELIDRAEEISTVMAALLCMSLIVLLRNVTIQELLFPFGIQMVFSAEIAAHKAVKLRNRE